MASLALEIFVVDLISRTKTGISESVFEIRAMPSLHVSKVPDFQSTSKMISIQRRESKKAGLEKPSEEAASSCKDFQFTNLEINSICNSKIIAIATLVVVLEIIAAERKYLLNLITMIRNREYKPRRNSGISCPNFCSHATLIQGYLVALVHPSLLNLLLLILNHPELYPIRDHEFRL